jgi:tetratricopeptide (TPR) repeat protein
MILPFRRRTMWAAGSLGALVAAGMAVIFWHDSRAGSRDVPDPDLSAAHPEIVRAVRAAQEEVRGNPKSALSWGRLGRVLMAHEIDEMALDCFQHAAHLDPKQFRWPYCAAVLEERRDFEKALADYQRALVLDPRYAPLQYRIAAVLLKLGRCDDAERHFSEAARLAEKSPFPWLGLGRAALSRGDRAAARAHFEEALARAPHDRTARSELARICFLMGDLEEAARQHEEIAKLPPPVPEMPDDVLQSIDQLKAGVLKLADQAEFLAARGDLAGSAEAARTLMRSRPDLAGPRLSLGMALERQGDASGAVAVYREALEKFPGDSLVHYRLALALESLHDVDGAVQSYRECLKAKPDYALAWYGLGLLLKSSGDRSGAVEALREAVGSDPRHQAAHLALGLLLAQSGDLEAAIDHLRSAVELSPDDPVAQARLRQAREEHEARNPPTQRPTPRD